MRGRDISVLSVAITLLAVIVGGAILLRSEQLFFSGQQDNKTDSAFTSIADDSFSKAQYHFGHTEGAYDLVLARRYYTDVTLNATAKFNKSEVSMSWYQLARIDFLEGKYGSAETKLKMLEKEFGDSFYNVYYIEGLVYGYRARDIGNKEDWQLAEEAFKKFLAVKPESPWARTDLSWVYFAQGKFADMIPVLEEGLEYEPESPWLHNMYGLALLNTGQNDLANEHFSFAQERARLLDPEGWGAAYPGNDPAGWGVGLAEFQAVIDGNLQLTE
ncbi:hypothetical protein KC722_02885 [Candidatus Kaiserbacteria bacterium]|nr:hypothetical protein [Candidatus Kaiserbacteria bacterium]MCB9811551.1 hypothetical protein [Candidatus Nomurabacteria bacterium]